MKITLIGQNTLLIEMSGLVIMTDPWWGQFEFIRGVPLGMEPETVERIDLMLVSHNHIDHWCRPAIELAKKRGTRIIGSTKAVRRARRWGAPSLTAMRPGDTCRHEGITVHAMPAFHPFARDAIGFVVEGEKTFYFSGDTRFDQRLCNALHTYTLDIAMLQVACSKYPLVGKDGMDLDAAKRLIEETKPKLVIPIHYQVKGKTIPSEDLRAWHIPSELLVLEPGKPSTV